eukprot:9217233-Lingulodinium_polyedra.AAC.1
MRNDAQRYATMHNQTTTHNTTQQRERTHLTINVHTNALKAGIAQGWYCSRLVLLKAGIANIL